MLRLSLRLVFGGGREAISRLFVIAAGVMIGVALLLFALSGLNVINGSSRQICWQCTGQLQLTPDANPQAWDNVQQYPILWAASDDYFHGQTIKRVDIALRAPSDSQIPGIPHLPKDGEYYASPALARLMATTPANQLGNRFPGKMVGQIGRAGLNSPNVLIAVIGHTPAALQHRSTNVTVVSDVSHTPVTRSISPLVDALFGAAVGGLLFAVMTLIGTSTRLAAARREEKFATLRLVGATPRQINQFAAMDAAVSAGIGALCGLALFYALRATLAGALSSDVFPFFPSDLTPGLVGVLVVCLGAPFLAAAAAMLSLRRVRISPLGVARRATPNPPTRWRIALPLLGVLVVTAAWYRNRHIVNTDVLSDMVPYFIIGFGLIVVGMVVAGPWLTMVVNRLVARYARDASLLLASRRLADNPKAAFRPVSVLVVAVFLCTMVAVVAPLFLEDSEFQQPGANNIFMADQYFFFADMKEPLSETKSVQQVLEAVPGIRVTPVLITADETSGVIGGTAGISKVLISCQDAARLQIFGHCAPGATALQEQVGFEFNSIIGSVAEEPVSVYTDVAALQKLSVYSFIILTDGQPTHIEQLRTVIAQHLDHFSSGKTWNEEAVGKVKMLASIQSAINGGLIVVLFVAGCSLAVAGAGGLIERKRPFGLLRVAGMSLSQLVRVVLYESAAPLLAAALLAVGAALFTVRMLLLTFGDRPVTVPGLSAGYCILLGSGITIGLLMLLATLPILAVTTRPSHVRFE